MVISMVVIGDHRKDSHFTFKKKKKKKIRGVGENPGYLREPKCRSL